MKIKSNLFKIQIEKYENDINTGLAKEKKDEILDLFHNYNKICSAEEFNEVGTKLHLACSEGDVGLIRIYLSETIEDPSNDLVFKIDETNCTASLFKVNKNIEQLIIPRTVKHESRDYLITSISGTCKSIRTLEFVEDSAVETFYRWSFPLFSHIEEIYFPANLKGAKIFK